MARGGARPGAGRKKNTPNKASAARQEQVAAEGVTPLDVMLDNMRFFHAEAATVLGKMLAIDKSEEAAGLDTFKELLRFRQAAEDCAKDAAPYVHPKLAAIQHTGDDGSPLVIKVIKFSEIE